MSLKLDEKHVLEYLQRSLPSLGLPRPAALTIEQFKDGQSNPTYLLTCDAMKLVLRKAPPGHLLQGAHQVEREALLMQSLQKHSAVPLPRILLIEENEKILGTKFFLMQYVEGTVHRKPTLPDHSPAERAAVYEGLAASLAAIHNTPAEVIASVASVASGGSAGFCRRQVGIWSRQYALSSGAVRDLPQMKRLQDWLQQNIPYASDPSASASRALSVVHGDFRLDNVIYGPAGPQAVLDWELGGTGDGAMDLAYCCLGYYLPHEGFLSPFSLYEPRGSSLPPGIPSLEDFVASYKARLTPDRAYTLPSVHSSEWKFFLCLGLFRIASICAGVYSRALQGNASRGNKALAFKDAVPQLAELALGIISTGSVDKRRLADAGAPSAHANAILSKLRAFMEDCVLPNESKIIEYSLAATGVWPQRGNKWVPNPHIDLLRVEARRRGLWNLWCTKRTTTELQKAHPTWPWSSLIPHKVGLSHLDYAFIAIETGRSLFGAETCNCMAPDTGNMEVFAHFGTPAQQERWLLPLLDGRTRSCFGMTEPSTASSDPTQLQSHATKRGDGWVLQARKWWTTGACDSRCEVCIIIAITGGADKASHDRHSFLIVPMNSPGVTVARPLHVFGYDDAPGGHAETLFENVVLGPDMLLGREGEGFALAQSRLGPGRLHHCCRLLGHSERALQEAIRRGTERKAFGKALLDLGANNEKLALCRVSLRQAELTAMDAASELDIYDDAVSKQHKDVSGEKQMNKLPSKAIRALAVCKIGVPRAAQQCLDFAIQIHGGGGLSADHPLAGMWAAARTLRLVDGPDEVHIQALSKDEKKKQLLLIGKAQRSHPGIGFSKL